MRVAGGVASRFVRRADLFPPIDFDDLRQEGLAAVWEWSVRKGHAPDPSLAWGIARQAVVELLERSRPRGRPRSTVQSLDDPECESSRAGPELGLVSDVRDSMDGLTPALRRAVTQRLRGLGPKEAAAAERLTVRAMDSRRDRAYAALRRSLSAYRPPED
jgi:DNA-directed RNA polymerase specialized sigma24 family protein